MDPGADLRLAQAKEQAHDVLGRLHAKVEQDEAEFELRVGELALAPTAGTALAGGARRGAPPQGLFPERAERLGQGGQLRGGQTGGGLGQTWGAQDALQVHAPAFSRFSKPCLFPMISNTDNLEPCF